MSGPNLARFVAERRAGWEALELLLGKLEQGRLGLAELDELDRLYRRASTDLARARSSFPGADVAGFLNQLTARAYAAIYRRKARPLRALARFFGSEVPLAFHSLRRHVAVAALLLAAGTATGAVATLADERVAELFAPAGLVEGVREGKIWTDDILSVAPPSVVSAKILTNNVGVTFTAFFVGLLFCLPTGLVLFFNGFLVGSLGALCARHGILDRFVDFVLSHGILELTIICVAGGAGFGLGMALIDPGDLPRSEALRKRAREGMRLVIGCAPALLLLGFVEGYVSPGTLFPTWLKAGIGIGLEALFLAYLFRFGRAAIAEERIATAPTARTGLTLPPRIAS